MRHLLWVVLVGACVPVEPAPGQPAAAPTATASATCPQVYDCYTRCPDQACITACEAGVDPTVTTQARAFATCSIQNQCRDAACQQTRCGAEFSACAASGAQVASAPGTAAGGVAAGPGMPAPRAGAHTRLLMGIRQTGVGGSSYHAGVGWYVLFDDGKVMAHLPSEGLEGIDERAYSDLGTYQVNGDSMDMAFQNYRLTFTPRADGGWDSREGSFWPADSLDGAVLEGSYAGKGPVEISFTKDGRFDSKGGVMILTPADGLKSIPVGSGSYRVAQNTLTLAFASGEVYRVSICTLKASELPRASGIYLGGFEYHSR